MMKQKELNLRDLADRNDQRVVARLEGEIDDKIAKLWGEEFAASGGGKSPTPMPPGGAPDQ